MNAIEVVFWHWWIAALFLLVVELVAPGFFFIWLALAGAVVGFLLMLVPSLSFEFQLLIFSLLSVILLILWHKYGKLATPKTDHPLLNRRGEQYIGRTFYLIAAIENGQGKIRVDDSIWKVQGEDCPVNTKVRVIAVNGTQFSVEPCEQSE